MKCKHIMRAAWFRQIFLFAILVLGYANLAQAAAPDISFTPAALDFKYQTGAALPASQTLQIKSTGTALSFTITIAGPLPYSARWLSVSTNAGTTPGTLKIYVNPTGLPSGSYTGSIAINAPSAVTVQHTVPITLDVGDAPATLTGSTGSLTFTYVTGQAAPVAQPLVLMSSGGAVSAAIALSGGTWLKASPTGSITVVGLPVSISVSADPTGMAPGLYTGKMTISSSTAATKSLSVDVTLNVSAGVPTISLNGLWPPGVVTSSPSTIVTITGTNYFDKSVASIGATSLATTVLSSTTMLATIPAALLTPAGNLAITISTPTAASASAPSTFVVYPPGPQVSAVANSASYATSTVSPGGIITIYGIGLGPANLSVFPGTDPIPTALPAAGAATSITIDGTAAPILYTSGTQVSCIVPYAVAAKTGNQVDLVLTYNAIASAIFKVNVVDADPGVFSIDGSGVGQGAVLNINAITGDFTVNSSANAAVKGSAVAIYITGFGQTNPAGREANLIAASVQPVAAVTVTIDGQAATVLGAAAPIGSVPGLLQVNATVPATVKPGNAVLVVVSVGTAKSQARVTMAAK